MKPTILLFMTLLLSSVPVLAQQSQGKIDHKDVTITGCLFKDAHGQYELVDKEGIDNLPYSSTVDLDKYVKQTVTLVGRRASTPSAETTPGPLQTHFLVKKVQSASGQCNK